MLKCQEHCLNPRIVETLSTYRLLPEFTYIDFKIQRKVKCLVSKISKKGLINADCVNLLLGGGFLQKSLNIQLVYKAQKIFF